MLLHVLIRKRLGALFRKDKNEGTKQQYNQVKLEAEAVYAQARSHYMTSIKSKLAESGSNTKAWW